MNFEACVLKAGDLGQNFQLTSRNNGLIPFFSHKCTRTGKFAAQEHRAIIDFPKIHGKARLFEIRIPGRDFESHLGFSKGSKTDVLSDFKRNDIRFKDSV